MQHIMYRFIYSHAVSREPRLTWTRKESKSCVKSFTSFFLIVALIFNDNDASRVYFNIILKLVNNTEAAAAAAA